MERQNLLLRTLAAGAIFSLAALESRLNNCLYYAMHHKQPIKAAVYDALGDIQGWATQIWVYAYLICTLDVIWTMVFILADACGDSIVTWLDVKEQQKRRKR